MKELLDAVLTSNAIPPLRAKKGSFVVEETLGAGLLFASLFHSKPQNYALIATNQYSAQRLYEFLLNFLPEEQVVFFPSDELLRASALSSSRELLSQRLYALGQLQDTSSKKILVTHPSALLRYLPSPKQFKEETLRFKVGGHCDLKQLKARLLDAGYTANSKVEHSLQYASRGDILDIYSVSYLDPIRIEFFDDEIEEIKLFDIQTQQSKQSLSSCTILPATDMLLSDDQITAFVKKAAEMKKEGQEDLGSVNPLLAETLNQEVGRVLEEFVSKSYRPELYPYYGLAASSSHCVLDYFDPEVVYITNKGPFLDASTRLEQEAEQYLGELYAEGHALRGLRQYMPLNEALSPKNRSVLYSSQFATSPDDISFQAHRISLTGTSISSIVPSIQSYLSLNDKVVLFLPELHQRQTVESLLHDAQIEFEKTEGYALPEGRLGISEKNLSDGFEIPSLRIAFLSSSELFRHKAVASRFTSRFKEATILKSYEDLKPGDYVVHEYKGIGQFLDIQTIETDGVHRDYLHIAYAGNQFLYVPLEQFRLVRKYAGREGAAPKLSSLSGHDWDKKKAKIRARINELADRLIALYGSRARTAGYSFPPDDDLQAQFENEFPYTLTADQLKAVQDVKKDMESPEIMDRLLCGDVGFGKTEVAFRAAFKAICAGKQVALLCPTTLLCRQHFEVASERFGPFGVHLAQFSRLIPDSVQKENIELVKEGKIDFVIGTHRLLSKDFSFKDLGLLIVDEEQRFGVEQKERIKEMRKDVDVLTLSATPIPRTLQMSLVGIRPISEINTAPSSRMPIQTYVTPFRQDVVDELIQRELARTGQVYYVHNRVETIYSCANRLAARIPGAEVGVVHGQMEKADVESVMERFYDGTVNVLVCSSIVENGIDVPNANMIIVEDADHFGLSQLYQIKGRVGRGNRIAYAYLMYKENKRMNEEAQKRLQAIQEFTELGSGYKIAQRDLMIRGAGDILGPEQAGFIDSVGLDLYLKLLNEAVESKKTGVLEQPMKETKVLSVDAYIPGDYASKSDKIQLYQELEDAKSEGDILSFSKKIRDIYGRIPPEVNALINKKRIDLITDYEEFDSLKEFPTRVDIAMSSLFTQVDGIAGELFDALYSCLRSIKVTYVNKRLLVSVVKKDDWLTMTLKVLKAIHKTYQKHAPQSL